MSLTQWSLFLSLFLLFKNRKICSKQMLYKINPKTKIPQKNSDMTMTLTLGNYF